MPNKRKRGGQAGNKNALKHGFYSELYTVQEKNLFKEKNETEIKDEQKLLRAMILRLAEKLDLKGDLEETDLKALNTLANMIQTLNTTERTKLLARGHGGEIGKQILDALLQLDPYKEMEV